MSGAGPVGRVDAPEDALQEWTRLQVRAGLVPADELLAETVEAIEAELPGIDAQVLARAWIGGAQAEHRRVAAGWESPTDHDRLQAAWAECEAHGVAVREGVRREADVGDWLMGSAGEGLAGEGSAREDLRGVVWFEREAVWGAIRDGVLDVRLRGPDGTPVGADSWLAGAVLGCLDRHGLRARWHEGRVQVAMRWRRRAEA